MDGKIYKAIAAIMGEVSAIGKDKRNTQQGFQFRGIDDVYNALHPLLAKHGVFTVPEVINKDSSVETSAKGNKLFYEKLTIVYTFFADDGSFFKATVLGVGMDSGDKAANKAMAIGHKYAMLQVFCIPTEDMVDPDKESFDVMDQRPPAERRQTAGNRPPSQPAVQSAVTAPQPERSQEASQNEAQRPNNDVHPVPTTGTVNNALKITKITKQKFDTMVALLKTKKVSGKVWKNWLQMTYKFAGIAEITTEKYQEIFDILTKTPEVITGTREPGQEE